MPCKWMRERSVMPKRSQPEFEDWGCLFGKMSVVDNQVSERKEISRELLPGSLRSSLIEGWFFVRVALVPVRKMFTLDRLDELVFGCREFRRF